MSPALLISFAFLALSDPPTSLQVVSSIESVMSDAIEKADVSVVAISRMKASEQYGDRTIAVRGDRDQPSIDADQRENGRRLSDDPSFDYASGVVIGPKNAILTTFHSVKGAARIYVRAKGNRSFEAEIIAADPRSDMAVIVPRQSEMIRTPQLIPIRIGDASTLRKGAFLLALGNSYNAAKDGSASAAWGILSNTQRRIDSPTDDQNFRMLQNFPTLLQLDSKLNMGMSGGGVINMKGELVGLTTASANVSGFDAHAGYAIPMDALCRRVIESLREGREAEYGFLGISLDTEGSNLVKEALPGSPAGEGGVLREDAILLVGDLPVHDRESLVLAVNSQAVGKPVSMKISRNGRILEKTIVLSKYNVPGVISTNRRPAWRGIRVDYSSVFANQVGPFGQANDAMAKGGVSVVEVTNGSVADLANLKRGLIITRVNNTPTKTPDQFEKAVESLTGKATLVTDQGVFEIEPPPAPPEQ